MKKIICLMIALVFCVSLLTGCGKETGNSGNTEPSKTEGTKTPSNVTSSQAPSSSASEKNENTTVAPQTGSSAATEKPTEPTDPFDMDAFISDLVKSHPNASPSELCDEILKSDYFILYRKYDTVFSYPGIRGEYDVKSKTKEAYCVTDVPSGSVIMIIEAKKGIDLEQLASDIEDNVNLDWNWRGEEDKQSDKIFTKVTDGKAFFALYHSDIEPITEYAEKARDYVDMFHNYIKNHADIDILKMAEYLASHQNFSTFFAQSVSEGRLTGIGDFENKIEVTGFSAGAVFKPQVDPSDFIGYVFKVKEGTDVNSFKTMLKEKANLGWNVCITLNTIIVESDGDYVLFMMCNENID